MVGQVKNLPYKQLRQISLCVILARNFKREANAHEITLAVFGLGGWFG
jgi:hypothetical protein